MLKYNRIIFLDEEGTGLAPYASLMLQWKLHTRGIRSVEIGSRGNVVLFHEPANQKITEVARLKGFSLDDYRSKELDGSLFSENTLILTFNSEVKQQVYDKFPNAVNVYMIKEYLGESGELRLPVGGSLSDYGTVCAAADRVTDSLLNRFLEYNKD